MRKNTKKQRRENKNARSKPFLAIILVGVVCLLALVLPMVAAADLNAGLTLHYRMENASVIDEVGSNDGTNNGASAVVGYDDNALDFEATENDWIQVNNLSGWIAEEQGTFSFWMKPESFNATTQYIFEHNTGTDDRFGFYLDGDAGDAGVGFIFMNTTGGIANYNTTYVNGSWFHIVATWNSTGTQLWVEGELRDTQLGPNIVNFNDDEFDIGRTSSGSDRYYDGILDEIRAYNRVLTEEEIGLLYSGEVIVNLESPANASTITTDDINFTTSGDTTNFNNTNVTFYVWYDNGTLINQTSVTGSGSDTFNETLLIYNFTFGNYLWNAEACYENATFSNCSFAITNNSFSVSLYSVLEEIYENETVENAIEFFSTNISISSDLEVSNISLVYNGSSIGTIFSEYATGVYYAYISQTIPSVSADTNVTFYWSFEMENGFIQNTTSHNQTIKNIDIDNCTSYTNKIITFTARDEELQTLIASPTIELAVNIYSIDGTTRILNISDTYTTNPTDICLSANLTGNSEFILDAVAKYYGTGYATEYYNIEDLILTNDTAIQNITLYSLNASDSTDFQLTFNGEDFLAVEDALVYVERQYVSENAFKTVEVPKTDSNGQTILHLVRNDVIYNIRVVKNNTVLGSFTNIIAFCQDFTIGSCAITLNAETSGGTVFNYDDEVGILFESGPVYNDTTNVISFEFISGDGTIKTVSMVVERRDVFGNISICSNTLTAVSGTVSCNIGSGLTDTHLVTTIAVDGEEWLFSSVPIDDAGYGNIGYAMWFFMALGAGLMFSSSKNGVLLSILFSFIAAILMGWAVGGITGVGSAGIWLIVMVFIGLWRINRGRRS